MLVFGGVISDRLPRNLVHRRRLARAGHGAGRHRGARPHGERLDRGDHGAAGAVRRRRRARHPGRGRARPADGQPGAAAAGERAAGPEPEPHGHPRAGDRRRARRRRQSRDRARDRLAQLRRLRRRSSADPRSRPRAPGERAGGVPPRAPRGLAGVHVAAPGCGRRWSSSGSGTSASCAWPILGPVVAKADLGGAGAWGTVLAVGGVGAICGSVVAMRVRPSRPLVACTLAAVPLAGQMLVARAGAVGLAALDRDVLSPAPGSPST